MVFSNSLIIFCYFCSVVKYCQPYDLNHNNRRELVITDILRCGLCHSWRSVPQLTLWHFPESAGGSEAGQLARWSLRSSWKTKVRAHCWDTYSGNTSNPRNSMRSASWARYRIAYLLWSLIFMFNCKNFFLLTVFLISFFFFKSQLVKQICDQTDCNRVVDVGSGQVSFEPYYQI